MVHSALILMNSINRGFGVLGFWGFGVFGVFDRIDSLVAVLAVAFALIRGLI